MIDSWAVVLREWNNLLHWIYNQNPIGYFQVVLETAKAERIFRSSQHLESTWLFRLVQNKDEENIQFPLRHTIPENYIPSNLTPWF
jgi:hypothetical protein